MSSEDKIDSQILHDFHLNEDDLTNGAKHKFPFHTEILNSLINQNLTPARRHIIFSKLVRKHENIKSVLHYLASSPTRLKQKIKKIPMIVIYGMPRTGTTLLHNLMACDPACHAPFITDMTIHSIPPILRSNIIEHKRRIDDATRFQEQMFEIAGYEMKQYAKARSSSHADFDCEEDAVLQEEADVQCLFPILAPKQTNLAM